MTNPAEMRMIMYELISLSIPRVQGVAEVCSLGGDQPPALVQPPCRSGMRWLSDERGSFVQQVRAGFM
jgi:hypothetical protein